MRVVIDEFSKVADVVAQLFGLNPEDCGCKARKEWLITLFSRSRNFEVKKDFYLNGNYTAGQVIEVTLEQTVIQKNIFALVKEGYLVEI